MQALRGQYVRAVAPGPDFALPGKGPARRHRILGPIIGRPMCRDGPSVGSSWMEDEGGITGDDHLTVMDSTVNASFEDLELMSDRPMRRPRRRLRNADTGERMIYVA